MRVMFSKVGKVIFDNEVVAKTSDFNMGLEIEQHRVDEQGYLSQEPYPATIGDGAKNPWLTKDFLEAMSESVTPAAATALDALHYLYRINNSLRSALAPGELLWPLSMPPKLPADKSTIQLAKTTPEKDAYLKEWAKRRNFSSGTPCGVHINLSLNPRVVDTVYNNLRGQFANRMQAQTYLYTIIAQGFVRYRWFLTYLFGASPVAEENFFEKNQGPTKPVRSLRQSHYGFGTHFSGDYSSVQAYVDRIEQGAKEGKLISDYEFHGSVRFKGGSSLKKMPAEGVDYIELRMLDLDPSSSVGVRSDTLRFVRLLASYFVMTPALKPADVNEVVARADKMNEEVSLEEPEAVSKYQALARAFIKRLEIFANKLQLGPEYQEVLQDLEDRIENPSTTPSARLLKHLKDGSLVPYALERAQRYQDAALQSLKVFAGFDSEQILSATELSQQLFEPDAKATLAKTK